MRTKPRKKNEIQKIMPIVNILILSIIILTIAIN